MLSAESFGISGRNAPTISEKIVTSTLNAIQQLLPENKIEEFSRRWPTLGGISGDSLLISVPD